MLKKYVRPEKLYLLDILEAADVVWRFCDPVDENEFLKDELRQSAVLQKLTVIGVTAARLPVLFKEKHPEVEWEDIIGFRNIAVHEYFAVIWKIVWDTAMLDVPELRLKVAQILDQEYQEDL